ncbi:MAG: MATE family efflux transporter [Pseudomonadota bacterium]
MTLNSPLHRLPQDNKSTLLAVWTLGGPVAVQSVLASLLSVVDTLMVSALGPAALGGVGLVNRLLFVATMIVAGIASGVGVLVAQYCGAGRREEVTGPVSIALVLALLVTLPLTAVSLFAAQPLSLWLTPDADVAHEASTFLFWIFAYGPLTAISMTLGSTLRSSGNTRTPMWAGLFALGVNTLLNYLFITGNFGFPGYGVAAAAIATTIARILEIGWILIVLKPSRPTKVNRAETRLVLHSTLPLVFKEIFWAGGLFVCSVIISRMGKNSLAAFNLITPVDGLMISVFIGCGVASGILLGHAIGREAFDDAFHSAKRMRRIVPRVALGFGLVAALIVQFLRHQGWLLGPIDPALHDIALDSLTVLCLAVGVRTHNMMVSLGILRSGGDIRWLMLTSVGSMWLLNVPLVALAVFVLKLSLPWVVAIMMMEEAVKVFIYRWRVRSGRWIKRPLTAPMALSGA